MQYNGIILLSSYIHRLYAQQSIEVRLLDKDEHTKLLRFKEMLDDILLIMSMFEQTKDLTTGQNNKLLQLYDEACQHFPQFFKIEPTSLSEKVAIVVASFYGESHLNGKIIQLSTLFDTTLASDYKKRVQFYNERIKLMDFVVQSYSRGDDLKEELVRQIEVWYSNVTSIKQPIIDDLHKVPLLLNAN